MATTTEQLKDFYDSLQTLPKLIGDMALSIAEGQRRLDQNYLEGLAAVSQVAFEVMKLKKDDPDAAQTFLALLTAMVPPRYQFTETVVEVRADLQMTKVAELGVGGKLGIVAPFALSINASYTQRNGYDYRAAALVRTTLHAAPLSETVMDKLLARAGKEGTSLPDAGRYKAFVEALETLTPKPKADAPEGAGLAVTAALLPAPAEGGDGGGR